MSDCAKNVIILQASGSLQILFTKLSGVLKEILTKRNLGNQMESQILFDGLLPIDVKRPVFQEFNTHLFETAQDESAFDVGELTSGLDKMLSLQDIINEAIRYNCFGTKCLYKIGDSILANADQERGAEQSDF